MGHKMFCYHGMHNYVKTSAPEQSPRGLTRAS